MADHEAVLRRFQPRLVYDSNEAFFADSAAEWTDNPGNVLRRYGPRGEPGEVIAAATPGPGERQLSLDFLGHPHYADGTPDREGDAIGDPRRNYRDQCVALRRQPGYRNTIYGHAKEDSAGRLWLQYWFWYFFNDYHLAGGIGLHEGDWEMMQLRLRDDAPDVAVYAQHRWAERRSWDKVERAEGSPDTPLVYVARGSHASYFTVGYHETEAWYDIADGRRPGPPLRLELIDDASPPWAAWPGRWGDTPVRFSGIDQPSPPGPCAHAQWSDPGWLLEHSRTPTARKAAPAPEVAIARGRGQMHVAYDFTGRPGPDPCSLVVTVNSVDDHLPPRTFTFGVEGAVAGTVATRLLLNDAQHYDVYVSVTDASGRPSASTLTMLDPVGERHGGRLVVLPRLGYVVAGVRARFGRQGRTPG